MYLRSNYKTIVAGKKKFNYNNKGHNETGKRQDDTNRSRHSEQDFSN